MPAQIESKQSKEHRDKLDQLKRILNVCRGERQARTAESMADSLGITGRHRGRKVRAMILELIWGQDLAVVASGEGFFIPETWAEWEEYDKQMRGRIEEDCKRKAQVKKNVYNLFHGMQRVKMI